MGQYRQWLHYREINLQLRAQLEQIENEIAHLQAQVSQQDELSISISNPIFQAVIASLNKYELSSPNSTNEMSPSTQESTISTAEPISSALPTWNTLSNSHSTNIKETQQAYTPFILQEESSVSATPYDDVALQTKTEDTVEFFEEYGSTEPQLEIPWWLHNVINNSVVNTRPIDNETMRTNRLVQRWSERWGKKASPSQSIGEDNR